MYQQVTLIVGEGGLETAHTEYQQPSKCRLDRKGEKVWEVSSCGRCQVYAMSGGEEKGGEAESTQAWIMNMQLLRVEEGTSRAHASQS